MTTTHSTTQYLGLYGASKAWLLSSLRRDNPRLLVATAERTAAEELADDLNFFSPNTPILIFPSWDTLPFEAVSPSIDVQAGRIRVLSHLLNGQSGIVIATAESLLQRVLPPAILQQLSFMIAEGETHSRSWLLERFDCAGFSRVALVESIGDLSVRGSVIDFFPAHLPHPVRVEFLGDTITQLRYFDPQTQRSHEKLARVQVLPVREIIRFSAATSTSSLLPQTRERLKVRAQELEVQPRELNRILEGLEANTDVPGLEQLTPFALPALSSIFDYCSDRWEFVVSNQIALHNSIDDYADFLTERMERLSHEHVILPHTEELYLPSATVHEVLDQKCAILLDHLDVLPANETEKVVTTHVRVISQQELTTRLKTKVGTGQALKPLHHAISKWRAAGYRVGFTVGAPQRAERLQRLLLELNLDARILGAELAHEWIHSPDRYPLAILPGNLSAGFQLPYEKIAFIAEHEIFAERSHRTVRKTPLSVKRLMSTIAQLKEGGYVVHADYGIGRYKGLTHLTVGGLTGDFLHIEYADSKLFLPVQLIGKIQKFSAAEGSLPELDKLGSPRWSKTKAKVRAAVAELAGDLIKLYAARKVVKGWRFEPMGAEDERFADGFPYQETGDQLKAIEDTLRDMASDRPMDRLVCGDVGFGKTEIALRAAFKCVEHARQVAVLVPTTILAEQHRKSFAERFVGYPVKVAAVSRFHDGAVNRETLASVARGEIDIVVGTHRLLQKDVSFKDLGLVIIDEEHRFGVKQKERLKALKTQVDVLTLTATPIPRTLHMALLGVRDISVITTPPVDRRVIRTYIAEHNQALIRDAILRETQRNGQCFYVFNRIEGIALITEELRKLVPEARFEFAHGQMSEHQLEKIMRRFIEREIDVLVSTTIVESGIDIPNANTIILDRADMFGLAQLYQLRGRVGRSTRQAYAYLLIPHVRSLGVDAQKRLKALQALDDLGLGFNLALSDMEIRGAGNLLGKEQSGSVLAVGFELYTKILKEAVLNLKGEQLELDELLDPEVKIGVDAYIPDFHIPDISERLVMYQRLAGIGSPEEADELLSEIEDRFGPPPVECRNYVELMRIRALLRRFGVASLELREKKLTLGFSPRAPLDLQRVVKLTKIHPQQYSFSKNLTLGISLAPKQATEPSALFYFLEGLFEKIREAPKITA